MPQEAPADTAGPSSPPPRLPEGWLPQWEGVQRKWYYVQRATGKSQWEIPTEPVVLTPSTTPTSIGTGPSQAPASRPSANSPGVTGYGNTSTGGMYTAADSARLSFGMLVPGRRRWSTSLIALQDPLQQKSSGHLNMIQPPFWAGQAHPRCNVAGQPSLDRGIHQLPWGHGQGTVQGPPVLSHEQRRESYQAFSAGPAQHGLPTQPWTATLLAPHINGVRAEPPPPQPQWQAAPQAAFANALPHYTLPNAASSNVSQAYFGTYPSRQNTENCAAGFGNLSTQSSDVSHPRADPRPKPQVFVPVYDTHSSHTSLTLPEQGHSLSGHPLSRSHSHQSVAFPQQLEPSSSSNSQPSGYPPRPNSQSHYHGISMARTHSGPGMAHPSQNPTNEAPQYQNPLVQAGVNQYLSQNQAKHTLGATEYPGAAQYHQTLHHQPSRSPGHSQRWNDMSPDSRLAASDPHFVSGPWASSTPPTSGPSQPAHRCNVLLGSDRGNVYSTVGQHYTIDTWDLGRDNSQASRPHRDIVVGSVDIDGLASRFTQGGDLVKVWAPGTVSAHATSQSSAFGIECVTSQNTCGTVRMEGTSFAAPTVAGVMADLFSVHPSLRVRGQVAKNAAAWVWNHENSYVRMGMRDGLPSIWNGELFEPS
ncbi:WW/Rsp5/WWP [Penicillium alfredii]|uniref:WW/Rsp5/WWP n=1 Tax=Penicillium alfredii TaxID=1506179 RepID=A0A9W9GAR5_9EURO|nr:WW/Rsp5/WWP [Penicillium alfredii]KAJ5115299.1 WW/Rsp5/WWP [Penicillium alfredii]